MAPSMESVPASQCMATRGWGEGSRVKSTLGEGWGDSCFQRLKNYFESFLSLSCGFWDSPRFALAKVLSSSHVGQVKTTCNSKSRGICCPLLAF